MTITTVSKASRTALLAAGMAGLFLAMLITSCKSAPDLTGRWFATGKTMANGEQQRTILDLKQTGNQVAGNVRGLGFQTDVKGTVTGSHFELFGVDWNDKKPFITGDLVNGNLEGM
jgi:alpha-galactosidase